MAYIQLQVPEDLHLKIKKVQIELQEQNKKMNLREVYYEILRQGVEAYVQKKS